MPDRGGFRLLASPNPMARATTVAFALPTTRRVTVELYDLAGQRVRTLAVSREYPAGTHSLIWDGRDGSGRILPSGVYVLRLSTASESESRKIVMIR